ncbi:MAG: hypothetical protein ACSLFP_06925 [Acidimicrobiales bacterium]
MTTFEPLEARDVVLADEADARVSVLLGEVEDLTERMREVTAEVEAAEERASIEGQVELSESQQLTLQFVEDLVATNRERMSEVISERYVWVGQRLTEAQAEGQTLTGTAVAELATALAEHDGSGGRSLDDRAVADLLASIATASARSAAGSEAVPVEPEPAEAEPEEPAAGAAAAVDPAAVDPAAVDPAALDPMVADELLQAVEELTVPVEVSSHISDDTDQAAMIDDAVGSAVQAVLRALAEESRSPEQEGATAASRPMPEHLAWILPDPEADDGVGSEERSDASPRHDFWGQTADSPTPPTSRFAPRDLVISMLVLVLVVIVALVLVG